MNCDKCNRPNRDIAKFCKWCGQPISISTEGIMDDLVGMDEVKAEIKKIVNTMAAIKKRQGNGTQTMRIGMNTLIIGSTGSGKTAIANVLQQLFYSNKIVSKPIAKIVDAVDYKQFSEDWDKNIADAKGGILFIDNVQKLLPDGYSNNINELDKLFHSMDSWNYDPIVILAGLPEGFKEFLEANSNISNRFHYRFDLPEYSPKELYEIAVQKLQKAYLLQLDSGASAKMMRLCKYAVKTKDPSFGNGHFAIDEAEKIFKAYLNRITSNGNDNSIVIQDDIQSYVPEEKSLEQIMAELDEFIGMPEVKNTVNEIANQLKTLKEREKRGMSGEKPSMHMVLTGNPGTGKTTVARKLGEIFAAMEYLDSGHVIEVDRSQMVSQYKGETPKLVNELCDKAMGGILFVDEAYTLVPMNEAGQNDQYGKEAVETLMKRMEDDRDKFVVIAAGYKTEMDIFLGSNPGLKSRFDKEIHIEDYKPEELKDIFSVFLNKKKFVLSSDAESKLEKAIEMVYIARDEKFGNGREMRKLFEQTSSMFSTRISKSTAQLNNEDYYTILPEDIPMEESKTLSIDECLQELDGLIGLDGVKNEVRSLVKLLNFEQQDNEQSKSSFSKHYVFVGNPGTGKTTVARIMANVFKSLGLLSKGHLVEVDRNKLVAGYLGQTAEKVNQLVRKAMGGLLFIDEAYALSQGENDSFGKEAIDTLLKRIEDNRGKFICIIAGYPKEMEEFMETNSGLASRFNETIVFEDYKPKELTDIFLSMAQNKGLTLSEDDRAWLPSFFEGIYLSRDRNFGNAREVRKFFEKAYNRMANRIFEMASEAGVSPEMKKQLHRSDIEGEGAKTKTVDEVLEEMNEFIGMEEVKTSVRKIANQISVMKQRIDRGIGSAETFGLNVILTGNPGTGKTTVARKLGEIFKAIGYMPSNKVIEVDRSQMVSQYSGETPKVVNKLIDRAMGGILFIDEAYTLAPNNGASKDKLGTEAVETLMKRMEDDRGKFVVIAAGYENQMDQFLEVNPGLKSRFNERIHISDYQPDELYEIYKLFASKKSFVIPIDSEEKIKKAISDMYGSRDKDFGNARNMRQLFETTSSNMSSRLSQKPANDLTNEDFMTVLPEDIPFKEDSKELSVDECLGELNKLYGLEEVKNEVISLVNYLNIEKQREKQTGIKTPVNMHFVFTGNPGTGKTTVARIMANVFKSLGILPKGHLVEVDRSQLVAGYIGQTASLTNKVIDSAMGGLLFIDEAYTLTPQSTSDFGYEAIDALLKRLEDDRGKFICIAAGYNQNMEQFLAANPGLPSRFNKRIHFQDYGSVALLEIFKGMASSKGFTINNETLEQLPAFFENVYNNRGNNFGNAREVRKIFEKALLNQSERLRAIIGSDEYKPEMLVQLTFTDITKG